MSYDFGPAEVTSVTSYVKRDILVSRDASTLTDSINLSFGLPVAALNLPSELRDTTDVKQFSQELRIGSTGSGPFQWVFGAFYSKVDRNMCKAFRPSFDVIFNSVNGAGAAEAAANGFEFTPLTTRHCHT